MAISHKLLTVLGASGILLACGQSNGAIRLSEIKLPPGFSIALYAEVPNARQMVMSPSGTLFVGTRKGEVHAVIDENEDYKGDRVVTIAEDLRSPNGVEFRDGSLYVAEISRILRYDNIEESLEQPPQPTIVADDYPAEGHHGWKYIRFGPDGKLYVPVGAPCNICLSEDPIFAGITRLNADGTGREIIAHGIRNTVGFDFHPQTGELWFTDNGRDWYGDDLPPDELNRLTTPGQHFGYPFVHGTDLHDDQYWEQRPEGFEYTPPVQNLGPHVAALGMRFYDGDMFPSKYKNQVFIAEHGSWNRSTKIGYRVMLVTLDENQQATSYEPFATGWLRRDGSVGGRPVDVLLLDDGSMLVSDDSAGAIYRITYNQETEQPPTKDQTPQ